MKLAESASCYEAACVSQPFELLQKNCQVGRGYDVHAKKVNDFLNMTFGCMSLNQRCRFNILIETWQSREEATTRLSSKSAEDSRQHHPQQSEMRENIIITCQDSSDPSAEESLDEE